MILPYKNVLLAAALTICTGAAQAEAPAPESTLAEEIVYADTNRELPDSIFDKYDRYLDEVVVTGTRSPKLLKDEPVQTVLITSKDIERSDATNISDLLQSEIPGIEFSYAMNQQVHLNFGGFGGQSVLFLVDGERLAGETMDDVDFSRIDMGNVERIEIVRGASSALYGSNAAGGVINIITKEAARAVSATASARIARHNDQRYMLTLGLHGKHINNSLSALYSRIANYDVDNGPDPATRVITTIYGNRTVSIKDRLTYTPTGALRLTARAGYYFKEIPRITDTPERYRDYSAGLLGHWDINSSNTLEASYAFDQYDKSSFMRINHLDVRNYSNVTNSVRAFYTHTTTGGNILALGADYRYDYLDNLKTSDGAHHEVNTDIFAQYDHIFNDHWEAVGVVRYDYFSFSNSSRVTPKLSARYKPTRNTNIRFGYGMGFREPTLKERFYNFDMAGIWIVEGNKDLRSESSHNFNASFDWSCRGYNLTVAGYLNRVHNKIATGLPYYKPGDGNQLYLNYINLDNFTTFGGEITLQGRWNCGLSAKISYAYTDERFAKDKEGNTANNQYIPARKHTMTARVEWLKQLSHDFTLTLNLNGRALSGVKNIEYKDYYDIAAGTIDVHYPPYTIWRFSASTLYRSHIKLTLTVDNFFNYNPEYHYLNAPFTDGANFMAGISFDI